MDLYFLFLGPLDNAPSYGVLLQLRISLNK